MTPDFTTKTKALIDDLKAVCASYGLGNDGNEYKIITQAFLYKFLNDKFAHEVKQLDPKLAKAADWEKVAATYSEKDYAKLLHRLGPDCAKLEREHTLTHLFHNQNKEEFHKLFDDTLHAVAVKNTDIFSVKEETGEKVILFDALSQYITSPAKRDAFCRAIVNKLVHFSFEGIFAQKFDFFATIFEYLIKDYNKDGGGKYAEYYTPHAIAKIMAAILVDGPVKDVTCYDPSAGTGQLLMSLAHAIGEDKCSLYAEDISQKSSSMLRLNLVLNNLVHSIPNIIQGDTIRHPYAGSTWPERFDYIVSNPPFKLDFSDYREELDGNKAFKDRFFAGIPNVPKKNKDKMAIYLLFIQHIMYVLGPKGRAAIVVPTGFLTAKNGIELRVLKALIDRRMLRGAVSMPSNIFATTETNVSVLFLDKANTKGDIVLMDASKLGTTVKEGKNQKTLLSKEEEDLIIGTFREHEAVEDLSVVVSYDEIKAKDYSLSAGQYFDVVLKHEPITRAEYHERMHGISRRLEEMFRTGQELEGRIRVSLKHLSHD
ncbi:MAG: SAM-dependent DNA methyltransferase [Flavobacteriales bacterium]|nr:SAM-dependent DNA methyltransferase [Flavobacteriales bacterium]MEB2341194.1 class I SAM-dependent DNA methyltransferase [Flavobacteriia bacterium]